MASAIGYGELRISVWLSLPQKAEGEPGADRAEGSLAPPIRSRGDEVSYQGQGALRCVGENTVPTAGKSLEANEMRGHGRRDVRLTFYGGHGILLAAQHEGGAPHSREGGEEVERVTLSARSIEPARDFRAADGALDHPRIARGPRVEREGKPEPGFEGAFVRLPFDESPAGQSAHFRSAEALEERHPPLAMRASGGLRAYEDQFGGVLRMACRIGHGDGAPKRNPQDHRMRDTQRVTERAYVVTPLRQAPGLSRAELAPAISTMVEIDDLRHVRESSQGGLVDRMVEAGPAVKEDKSRLLPHGATIRHQAGALDVEEESHSIHEDVHVFLARAPPAI